MSLTLMVLLLTHCNVRENRIDPNVLVILVERLWAIFFFFFVVVEITSLSEIESLIGCRGFQDVTLSNIMSLSLQLKPHSISVLQS